LRRAIVLKEKDIKTKTQKENEKSTK